MDDAKIKDILLKQSYVSEEDMKKAVDYAAANHIRLMDHLITQGLVNKELLGKAIAEFYNVPFANLGQTEPSAEQVKRIPETIARQFGVVIFKIADPDITITTYNPLQPDLVNKVATLFPGKKIALAFSFSEDIAAVFKHYKAPLTTRISTIIAGTERIAPELIEEIVDEAVSHKSSDIHFEPTEQDVLVRFRIDGILQEAGRIPLQYYENILNRIKVLAHLRIDEHFSAQDGAIRLATKQSVLDMRISIVPTLDGEKIAVRILSDSIRNFGLADLGLSADHESLLMEAARQPFGMILVTGPTGSGKTTSLYALLKLLNKPEVNITTIEDPVEYKIVGLNQIQVNGQTNLTFAQGLRTIVRQDPNIILVGEIRDVETAEIAVNAALTGHLLLSTFHANNAETSIPRLIDMGIEPFLLASTLQLVIAQRLVRKICTNCRYSISSKDITEPRLQTVIQNHISKDEMTFYRGKGCDSCNNTGYKGRIAIYEFIKNNSYIQDLIVENPSAKQIWETARAHGAKSLFEDGIEKVKSGITTIEELLRVASPTSYEENNPSPSLPQPTVKVSAPPKPEVKPEPKSKKPPEKKQPAPKKEAKKEPVVEPKKTTDLSSIQAKLSQAIKDPKSL